MVIMLNNTQIYKYSKTITNPWTYWRVYAFGL